MSKASTPKGSRLESVRERMEKAVSEAEAAVDRFVFSAKGDGRESEALEADLRTARSENAALRQANDAVSERLDQVILRLKSVLET